MMSRKQLALICALAAAASACSKENDTDTPEAPTAELSGSVKGSEFNVVGSRGVWQGDAVIVTLANRDATCALQPEVADGRIRVDINIPRNAQTEGHFSFTQVGVGVTRTSVDDTGAPSFDAVSLSRGDVWIAQFDTEVKGAIRTNEAGIELSGSFVAPLCPP